MNDERDNVEMNTPAPISPRRRLQELLAIPDKQRTDAEWDELIELEISLAPGNRADGGGEQNARRGQSPSGNPNQNPRPRGGEQPKKPFKKFHKRPPPKEG